MSRSYLFRNMHSLAFGRFFCSVSSLSQAPYTNLRKRRVVFMGSPQVSVTVLDALLDASSRPHSIFEVAGVVTQPPSARDRGRKVMPSPIGAHALLRGISPDVIFTPQRASCEAFLSDLKQLRPDVCVTAAYGNILPTEFLSIPAYGTVNIHPSLLPLYRGAAPVQRALQDGVKETGVSVAFTVREIDAGPVIAVEKMHVDDDIKAPDLLACLFDRGAELLVEDMPWILDGSARERAWRQDDSRATPAPKVRRNEGWLSFKEEGAVVAHNKVRSLAGWPGTWTRLALTGGTADREVVLLKIITTTVGSATTSTGSTCDDGHVTFERGRMVFPCHGGTALHVLEVQLPGKKVMTAAAFWNGLRRRRVTVLP